MIFSSVCLYCLPFLSVAINLSFLFCLSFRSKANSSFLISATDEKSDVKYRLKHFSPGDLPVEKIVIAFGEGSFSVKKSFTGNDFLFSLSLLSAFLVRGQ
ncbi:hypothetical protein [Desulfonatronovibrio magnus]|uniref:hypothetical protein n=1 Tax=Desulfonatronovibrio magnus TaxID=698827 RepID=UPI0005EB2400|nr:hypothetical protein [Desulfonatronovibrio magnus]